MLILSSLPQKKRDFLTELFDYLLRGIFNFYYTTKLSTGTWNLMIPKSCAGTSVLLFEDTRGVPAQRNVGKEKATILVTSKELNQQSSRIWAKTITVVDQMAAFIR